MQVEYMQIENTGLRHDELAAFLHEKSDEFAEPLESRVDVNDYCWKLLNNGYVFVALVNGSIAGVIAGYANDMETHQAYESVLVTDKSLRGSGAAKKLFEMQNQYCKEHGMKTVYFTTDRRNIAAAKFYEKMNVPVVKEKCTEKVIGYIQPL